MCPFSTSSNAPKREGKKGFTWVLFPLFSTQSSRQNKKSTFPRWEMGLQASLLQKKLGFSHYLVVMVDTSRRAFAATLAAKSEVMRKTKQELRRSRKLPWPPKLIPLKGNDHRSPVLRWSLLILNMKIRKNSLEIGESIYWISMICCDEKGIRSAGEIMSKTVWSNLIMQTYMSQFNYFNCSCQAFNVHHPQHQKWTRD